MTYTEHFDDGPGGWLGWISNAEGAKRLEMADSAVVSRGPWWIDYNHAPPGAGYLHLLFALHTHHPPGLPHQYHEVGGPNRFVAEGCPRDFTDARVTARLRGELDRQGAECVLLVQSKVGDRYVNVVLSGQPFVITPDWRTQTVQCVPDAAQWTALGSRHDRIETYGDGAIEEVLRDVNGNIIFVLFPLNVRPKQAFTGDMHRLRAGEDYEVDRACLASGYVMMDEVRIEFNT